MTKTTTKIVIAIDGPAASGKGSLAKKLAKELGYDFLDTGALYRRVALNVLEAGGDITDEQIAVQTAEDFEKNLNFQRLAEKIVCVMMM